MSALTPPELPREKSLRPWILLAVIFVVVMVPLLILLHRFVNYRSGNAEAVVALEAKIRANHEPLTLEELAATFPPIPAQDNGAEVLLQLWETDDPAFWHAFRAGTSPLPSQKEMVFDEALPLLGSGAQRIDRVTALKLENVAAGNAYLEAEKEHLATVRTALGYPKYRFPIQLTKGFAMLIPHDAVIKREATNFRIEGLLAAERGDVNAAIGSLEDAAKTGKILASEPTLISQLVRWDPLESTCRHASLSIL